MARLHEPLHRVAADGLPNRLIHAHTARFWTCGPRGGSPAAMIDTLRSRTTGTIAQSRGRNPAERGVTSVTIDFKARRLGGPAFAGAPGRGGRPPLLVGRFGPAKCSRCRREGGRHRATRGSPVIERAIRQVRLRCWGRLRVVGRTDVAGLPGRQLAGRWAYLACTSHARSRGKTLSSLLWIPLDTQPSRTGQALARFAAACWAGRRADAEARRMGYQCESNPMRCQPVSSLIREG